MLKTTRDIGLTWRMIAALLGLHVLGTIFEGLGLTILLPVFELIRSGQTADALAAQSRWWGYLVDAYHAVGMEVTIPVLLVSSFLAILLRQAMIYARLVYSSYVKFTVIRRVRDRAFRAFLGARLGYGEREGTGRIANELTTEAQVAVEGAMSWVMLVGMLLLALIYLSILFALSVEMTVAAILVMALAVMPVAYLLRRGSKVGALLVSANSALLNFLSERLKAARLVRLSGMEAAEYQNMRAHTAEQYKQVMEGNVLRARTTVVIEPIAVAAGFAFLFFGVTELGLTLEQIGLFLVVIIRLVPVVKELAQTRYAIANQSGSVTRVRDRIASLDAAREEDTGGRTDVTLERAIRIEDLRFSYDNTDDYALRGVSVVIPARRVTALVGPSGSGKSTLIDMLPRLRVPTAGTIRFDDTAVEAFALSALRQAISYAPQSPQIFNVSIREHIHYGQPDADQAAIERAARLAGAHEFIERLPEGYDTIVSEAGLRLSGGQRQRLDLARALLKPAKILILDEPTSQLDAEAETRFREALERIKAETELTVIIVGHRFATLSVADQIVVLQHGRVDDAGTHAELMKRGGWYARAHRQQNDTGLLDAVAAS